MALFHAPRSGPVTQRVFAGCPDAPCPSGWSREPGPTAFLDRDGVLNVDHGYVSKIADFQWIPGAQEAIDTLIHTGHKVVVVTNQSGIGRGLYNESEFLELSAWLLEQAPVSAIVYCPHAPEAHCHARKPQTGMLERADLVLGVDKASSFLIGDKATDIVAADRFGVTGLLFTGGNLRDFLRDRLGI